MNEIKLPLEIVIPSLAAIMLIIIAFFVISTIMKKRLYKKSPKLSQLKELNKKNKFYSSPDMNFNGNISSKKKYDNLYIDGYVIMIINENRESVSNNINANLMTKRMFNKYIEEVKKIEKIQTSQDETEIMDVEKFEKFLRKEEKEFKKRTKKFLIKTVYNFNVSYTSPAGKNHYEKNYCYNFDNMLKMYNGANFQANKGDFVDYQRSLVTSELRYKVMKRDGFRCVLCGRRAEDGAKLEVDHIVPVSKGGLSVMSNLRTLCKECNRGKLDKYDSNGLN